MYILTLSGIPADYLESFKTSLVHLAHCLSDLWKGVWMRNVLQLQQNNYYYAQRIPSIFFYSLPKFISGTIPISLTLKHQCTCHCRQNTMAIKKSITIAVMPLHEKKNQADIVLFTRIYILKAVFINIWFKRLCLHIYWRKPDGCRQLHICIH